MSEVLYEAMSIFNLVRRLEARGEQALANKYRVQVAELLALYEKMKAREL